MLKPPAPPSPTYQQYNVVYEHTIDEMVRAVNQKTLNGWKVHGSMFNDANFYIQPITKTTLLSENEL